MKGRIGKALPWGKGAAWAAALVLPPITAAYFMQLAYGVAPWQMAPLAVVGNGVCLGVLYYLLCALTGRWVVACLILHLASGLWGAANYFVSVYRGNPVLPWDLTALETAAAVSGTYDFTPTLPMVLALVLLVGLGILLVMRLRTGRMRWALRGGCLLACALCLTPVLHPEKLAFFGIKTDVWDQAGAYRTSGAMGAFLRNTEFLEVEKPEGLTVQRLAQLLGQEEDGTASATQVEDLPNVIAIMNESWADFEEFGNLELSQSVNEYISTLDNAIWGHAYASVFGAGTSASEFEFLTGNSMAFLPSGSIPYQQYILDRSPSLVWLMREAGYETRAFHPGERTSWQRDQAYPLLGFESFKCGEDMDVPQEMAHGYVSDSSDFDQVIWEYEHWDPDRPLFLFNVTIQNHGSYTDKTYPAQVQLTDEPGAYPMAEQYLTLARETNQAFQKLVEYFSQQEEPTIILMFGDHQPSVEQEFLDKAYGVTQDEMTMEQYMDKYRVPYVVWANFPLEEEEQSGATTSLNFLSQYILEYTGVQSDSYFSFLDRLRQTLPAITFVGYLDQEGNAYSHLENNEFTSLIEDYQCVQYERLFGLEGEV